MNDWIGLAEGTPQLYYVSCASNLMALGPADARLASENTSNRWVCAKMLLSQVAEKRACIPQSMRPHKQPKARPELGRR
jgi:hypothetical protein